MIAWETDWKIDRIGTVLSVTDHTEAVFGKFIFRYLRKLVEESFSHIETEAYRDVMICSCVRRLFDRG